MGEGERQKAQLWVRRMTTWRKAFLVACVLELPLLITILPQGQHFGASILDWYHAVSAGVVLFVWYSIFGHGGPTEDSRARWHLMFFGTVYAIQVVLTTPILFSILRFVERFRNRGKKGG